MKKLLVAAVAMVALASVTSWAQGTIVFNNRISATVNVPVTMAGGNPSGADYWAGLYAGPSGTAEGALTLVGTSPFRTGAGAGFFTSATLTIGGVQPGASAALQVRAWFSGAAGGTAQYATYEAAPNTVAKGTSAVFASLPLGGIDPVTGSAVVSPNIINNANPLNNMGTFALTVVPEPSVLALGALGALALIARRRKA